MFWAVSCWKPKIKTIFYHVFWEAVTQYTPLNLYLVCLELETLWSQMQEEILLACLLANILEC